MGWRVRLGVEAAAGFPVPLDRLWSTTVRRRHRADGATGAARTRGSLSVAAQDIGERLPVEAIRPEGSTSPIIAIEPIGAGGKRTCSP